MSTDVSLDLDDALIAAYRQAAIAHGRSLEEELRAALQAQRPVRRITPAERLALSDRALARTPPSAAAIDSTQLIREDRDAR